MQYKRLSFLYNFCCDFCDLVKLGRDLFGSVDLAGLVLAALAGDFTTLAFATVFFVDLTGVFLAAFVLTALAGDLSTLALATVFFVDFAIFFSTRKIIYAEHC